MAWDHPTGLATAEIGDGSLNGLNPLLMSDPFVKVWALAPFPWEKTQNHKIKKPHRISPKRIIQNPKESTHLTSSSFAAASASSTPR